MADPFHSPPSPPPPDPKPPTPAAAESPNKRKDTTAAASPTNKRPNRGSPSTTNTTDIEDAATSKRKVIVENVELDDIDVLEGILEFRSANGVFPFENPTAMKTFLMPWLIMSIGNEAGWRMKLEHVRTKFTKESVPIEDGERKEFEIWKQIWAIEEGGDEHDPSVGS